MNIQRQQLEADLKARTEHPYVWGRRQTNDWDSATSFIYDISSFTELLKEVESLPQDMKDYAMNRWYNFWSAMGVEDIFAQHKAVIPNINEYDKLVDFTINNIAFDHKSTVFPRGFPHDYEFAKQNPKRLIRWLYENQSKDGRYHLGSRLFVVLKSKEDDWKLKADLGLIQKSVDDYMLNFSKSKLITMKYPDRTVYTDIIWVED